MNEPTTALEEWRRYWPTVLAAMVGMSFYTVLTYSLSTFIGPLEAEFGWSRTALSSGLTVFAGISMLGGPFIGMAVDKFGTRKLGIIGMVLAGLAFAAFSLLNTAYGFFVLPESLSLDKRRPFQWKVANLLGAFQFIRSHAGGGLGRLVVAAFFYYMAHESLPSMFVLYTDYKFHWNEKTVGLVLGAVGVSSMLVSAVLTGRAVKRWGEAATLVTGQLFGIAGFACYGYAPSSAIFLAGVPLIGLWGVCGPTQQALMSAQVDSTQQGQLQGSLSSLRGISGMISPLLFTQSFAYATSHHGPAGLPYYLSSALLVASLLLSLPALHGRRSQPRSTTDI